MGRILEYGGFILIVGGVLILILSRATEIAFIQQLAQHHDLFYWGGLAAWALGFMMRQAREKKEKENQENIDTK